MALSSSDVVRMIMDASDSEYSDLSDEEDFSELSSDSGKQFLTTNLGSNDKKLTFFFK